MFPAVDLVKRFSFFGAHLLLFSLALEFYINKNLQSSNFIEGGGGGGGGKAAPIAEWP